jgi:hypothetical protein
MASGIDAIRTHPRVLGAAAGYPVAPGAHHLWPDFTGHGAWMLVTARKGPAEALTARDACGDSCHRAFTVIRDARPVAGAAALALA